MSRPPPRPAPKGDPTREVARLLKEGVAAQRLGRLAEAAALYRRALKLDPRQPDARHLLGVVAHAQGDQKEAARRIEAAIAAAPERAPYHNSLGVVRLAEGDWDGAAKCFERALALDPLYPEAFNNLGNARLRQGDMAAAIEAYDRALALRPDYGEALGNRGRARHLAGRHDEAIADLRQALDGRPNAPRLWRYLGEALAATGDRDGAEEALRAALARAPDDDESQAALAALLEKRGRLEDAAALAAGLLARRPSHARAALVAARCARRVGEAARGLAFLAAVPAEAGTTEERATLAFEQGLILDQLGRHPEAFAAFLVGNRLLSDSAAARAIDREFFVRLIERLMARFTPEWLATWTPAPPPSTGERAPIFLIGFPRSGTTLLEQILDAHPALTTMEEKDPLDVVRRKLAATAEGYPDALAGLAAGEIAALRRLYFEEVAKHLGGAPQGWLVDKMPLNTIDAGLIYRLFPDARILLALRHPCDVVLSGFMQAFQPNAAMLLFDSLESTADFYARVMTLWRRYRECLPLAVFTVRYEDLTRDVTGVARGLLDFLGLPWDDAVLGYAEHAKSRAINTPSYHQVIRPIHRGAVDRWRRYRFALDAVLPVLTPFSAAFGYDLDDAPTGEGDAPAADGDAPAQAPMAAKPMAPEPESRRAPPASIPPKA